MTGPFFLMLVCGLGLLVCIAVGISTIGHQFDEKGEARWGFPAAIFALVVGAVCFFNLVYAIDVYAKTLPGWPPAKGGAEMTEIEKEDSK